MLCTSHLRGATATARYIKSSVIGLCHDLLSSFFFFGEISSQISVLIWPTIQRPQTCIRQRASWGHTGSPQRCEHGGTPYITQGLLRLQISHSKGDRRHLCVRAWAMFSIYICLAHQAAYNRVISISW